MNYYMSNPFGINPANLGQGIAAARVPAPIAVPDVNETALASSAPSSALAASPPAGYSYVGCFTDIPGETLSDSNKTSNLNTPLACSQFCPNIEYFGLEFGDECYCGKSIDPGSIQVLGGCNTPCAGDSKQTCGGPALLSIYKKGTQTS